MSVEVNIITKSDTISPMLGRLSQVAKLEEPRQRMMENCEELTRQHLAGLGPNKQGWPTTGFYKNVADNITGELTGNNGFTVKMDHPDHPGAMRQRYYGGTIRMKDKMLTIPARAEFYGHSATEFTNLRLAVFRNSGTLALVVGEGGVGHVDFSTGRERSVRGAGARAESMVAYWLKEEVTQEGDPGVIPTTEQYRQTAMLTLSAFVDEFMRRRNV